MNNLLDFVFQRCKILVRYWKTLGQNRTECQDYSEEIKGGPSGKSSLTVISQSKDSRCVYCKHDQSLYRSFAFKQKSVAVRKKFINNNGICFICLRLGLHSMSCSTTFKYRSYGGEHNILLHVNNDKPVLFSHVKGSMEKMESSKESAENKTAALESTTKFSGTVNTDITMILGMAFVLVRDSLGGLQSYELCWTVNSKFW